MSKIFAAHPCLFSYPLTILGSFFHGLKTWLFVSVGLSILLLNTAAVLAHQPFFNDAGSPTPEQAWVIEDVGLSAAIFGALRSAEGIDYYRLDVPAGYELDLQLFVPRACGAGFRPQLALAGDDVDDDRSSLPGQFVLPGLTGVKLYTRDEWGTFFEPFDPSVYAAGPEIQHTSAAGGTYYVVVFDQAGNKGSYMLGMGGREEFSGGEEWRSRKAAYDRCEVGQSNFWWANWRRFTFLSIGTLVIFGSGVYLYRRRNSEQDKLI